MCNWNLPEDFTWGYWFVFTLKFQPRFIQFFIFNIRKYIVWHLILLLSIMHSFIYPKTCYFQWKQMDENIYTRNEIQKYLESNAPRMTVILWHQVIAFRLSIVKSSFSTETKKHKKEAKIWGVVKNFLVRVLLCILYWQ